jgi:16S rRNA (cytosine967-C5)-methyltransferase
VPAFITDISDPGNVPAFIAAIGDPVKRLSVKYSMPEDLVSLITSQYGDEAESILRGLNEPPEVILRVNTLKTSRDRLIADLSEQGITAGPAEGCDAAVAASGRGIIGSELYRKGHFTVQSLSSMLAVSALAPEPGSRVLDMCAAPGGKSTMMAEMMKNEGSVTACDIHEHRLELIKASAARTGADIIGTRLMDGTQYDGSLEGQFDYVLADVPCSGLGVMSTKPEIRLRTDVSEYAGLTDTQLEILENAFRYTRPGGRICYSTCTLNKDENGGVIRRFMDEGKQCADGFARIVEMRTIVPYNNLIGFYYCIIEKSF